MIWGKARFGPSCTAEKYVHIITKWCFFGLISADWRGVCRWQRGVKKPWPGCTGSRAVLVLEDYVESEGRDDQEDGVECAGQL